MKDAMIDLETFGNGKNACICQIGACYFDRKTGEIGKTFKVNVDARTAVFKGGEFDADTVYWWLSQSRTAIDSITKGDLMPIDEAMHLLNEFLAECDNIWSHATFDFVIVTETLKLLRMKPRFHYRAARDLRTLTDIAGVKPKDFSREGVHHDALDDCKFQVKYTVAALNKLGRSV